MYDIFITHDDMEGPDGHSPESYLCSFTKECEAEAATQNLSKAFFPTKSFFYSEKAVPVINPSFEHLRLMVEETL